MAVIAVRTNDGEELCSWYIEGDPDDYWRITDAELPGLAAAVEDALRKEQKRA